MSRKDVNLYLFSGILQRRGGCAHQCPLTSNLAAFGSSGVSLLAGDNEADQQIRVLKAPVSLASRQQFYRFD